MAVGAAPPFYPSGENAETLIELDRMFRIAADHPIVTNWRFETDLAFKFAEGDQWTREEKGVLTERGQPIIVENEIRPTLERLKGQFRQNRTTVKFVGRNEADEGLADAQSDVLRHIDYINQFEFTEGEIVDDQLIGGQGWLEVTTKVNELGQREVRYRREDPFTIFLDPFCRTYDINDEARYICRAKWFDVSTATQLWGKDKAALIEQCLNTSQPSLANLSNIDPDVTHLRNWDIGNYYDTKTARFRPVEIWYKKRATEFLITTPDGQTQVVRKARGISASSLNDALAEMPGAKVEERSIDQIWVAVYCGGIFLDGPKPSPYRCNLFPFVPYYAYRKIDGQPQGYVWGLMDPQREINARRSKSLWSMNNRQSIYERNAVKDPAELAAELAKMDGQIVLEQGKFDKFMIKENQDITSGNISMMMESKAAIRRISGEDQLNPAPEVRSGTGIQRLQQIHAAGVLPLFDNIRRSRRMKAKLTHEFFKQYYTDEMLFQIEENPDVTRQIRITSEQMATIKEASYDLVIVDTQQFMTSQAEQYEMLTTSLPQIIQHGPQWAKLLVSMSELRNKEVFVKMIDNMAAPPPVQPKISISLQWNELSQAEKAVFAQQFQWTDLAQVEMQMPSEPASLTQNKAELMKMQMKTDSEKDVAMITAAGKHHDQRVALETAAMANQAKIIAQRMQNEQRAKDQARSE